MTLSIDLRGSIAALLAAALLGAAGAAGAVIVAGPGGAADAARRGAPPAPASAAAPTLDLIAARIDAVDAVALRLTVGGRTVPLHAGRLRVIGPDGRQLPGLRSLRAGMSVRFALEPEAAPPTSGQAPERRIVLIYIDRQP